MLAVPAKDRLESLRLYIANNLIIGFLLMMVVEHLMVGNHNHGPDLTRGGGTQLEFDAELGELETDQHGHSERRTAENMRRPVANQVVAPPKQKAIPFTIGLIIHGMADGCALGVSAFEGASSQNSDGISLIIFLALLFHKGEVFSQTQCNHLKLLCLLHPPSICSTYFYGICSIPLEHKSPPGRLQETSCNIRIFDSFRSSIHLLSSLFLWSRRQQRAGWFSPSHICKLRSKFIPLIYNLLCFLFHLIS